MSLNWSWEDKVGELEVTEHFDGGTQPFTLNLYQGNALLIMIQESMDGEYYHLYSFWNDKAHAERLLGLKESGRNIYNGSIQKITKVVLYRDKLTKTDLRLIVSLFTRADFEELEITLKSSSKSF